MPLTRLALTDFRSYPDLLLHPGPGLVILTGENGAGKTNVLEAVSLLAPGRGLRGATLGEMARSGGPGGFAVAAQLDPLPLAGGAAPQTRGGPDREANASAGQAHPAADAAAHHRVNRPPDGLGQSGGLTDPVIASGRGGSITLGTGTLASAPERRLVRIDGAPAAANALAGWLSVLWLTPAMDRLFTEGPGGRRRFLDRLTLALDPAHASHAARYEAAMRARNKLLGEAAPDPDWLTALEARMADHGAAIEQARAATLAALAGPLAAAPEGPFARAALALEGGGVGEPGPLAAALRQGRTRDAAAGRTLAGPHRADLLVTHAGKNQPAARSSTGEQKALLLTLVLAHADLVRARGDDLGGGRPLILLLDEVAAHLDPTRRAALFARLGATGSQVWMTGTEPALFEAAGASASRFNIRAGAAVAA